MKVTGLNIYPIKSLPSLHLPSLDIAKTGPKHDREWMLITESGTAYTLRDDTRLVGFEVGIAKQEIVIKHLQDEMRFGIDQKSDHLTKGSVWGEVLDVFEVSKEISAWFSDKLKVKLKLVGAPSLDMRTIKADENSKIHFPDAAQFLIVGEESLKMLNEKLETAIPIDRFRSNITFEGGAAHCEDTWDQIKIGQTILKQHKLCGRCKVITMDQKNGNMTLEPLKTLAKYRRKGNKVLFGSYFKLLESKDNKINLADTIEVISFKAKEI